MVFKDQRNQKLKTYLKRLIYLRQENILKFEKILDKNVIFQTSQSLVIAYQYRIITSIFYMHLFISLDQYWVLFRIRMFIRSTKTNNEIFYDRLKYFNCLNPVNI